MGDKGERTRTRILDVAQRLILQKGYAGTAIDEIVYEAEITKGGFFYHFKNRNDLARALMLRYLEEDERIFRGLVAEAHALVDDPLQRVLAFLKLLADMLGKLDDTHPGCLAASFTYESQQFDVEIRNMTQEGVESWKRLFLEQFEPVMETHDCDVPLEDLADMLNVSLEGAILLSRIEDSNRVLSRQIMLFRDYVRRVFRPRTAAAAS